MVEIMKIRLITGTCYIAVLLVFYLLKIFVSDLFFDALIYAFALIGTFEMTRAMGERITRAEKIAVFAFAAVCLPACALAEEFAGLGVEAAAICFFALAVALLSLLVARHDETTPEKPRRRLFSPPSIPPCCSSSSLSPTTSGRKETGRLAEFAFNSDLAILFIFVISPFADSLAYVFGRFLKGKFPKKMAPVVSPNKTVIGGIGGLVGGAVGAAILYFGLQRRRGQLCGRCTFGFPYIF